MSRHQAWPHPRPTEAPEPSPPPPPPPPPPAPPGLTFYFDQTPVSGLFYVLGAAQTKRNEWFAQISGGVHVETFESFADNAPPPLPSIFGGLGALAMLPGAYPGEIERTFTSGGVTPGRFNTTGAFSAQTDGGWWQADDSFKVTFATPVNAFGTYMTDANDFGATMTCTLSGPGGPPVDFVMPFTLLNTNGGLAFFGFTDGLRAYDTLTFTIVQHGGDFDVIGFDDMTIGTYP